MAGALLVIPFAIILNGAFSELGFGDQAGEQAFFVSVAAGGAVALLLSRRLRANATPLPFGCGAVVAWTILMMLAVGVGWVGMALVGVGGLAVGIWITRPRRRHPA